MKVGCKPSFRAEAVVKLELGELTVTREFSGDETTKLIVLLEGFDLLVDGDEG